MRACLWLVTPADLATDPTAELALGRAAGLAAGLAAGMDRSGAAFV